MNAVGYVRVAAGNFNTDFDCVEMQKDTVVRYCELHGIDLKNIYVDAGFSGLTFDRPGFQKMLDGIKNKTLDGYLIITINYDRISRNFSDLLKLNELLVEHRMSIVSIQEPEGKFYKFIKDGQLPVSKEAGF